MTKEHLENFNSPSMEPHKYYRNLVQEFIKIVQQSQDINLLEIEMEKLINASRDLHWKISPPNGKYEKLPSEKLLDKTFNEFERYVKTLQRSPDRANNHYLLDSLHEVLVIIENYKVA